MTQIKQIFKNYDFKMFYYRKSYYQYLLKSSSYFLRNKTDNKIRIAEREGFSQRDANGRTLGSSKEKLKK